MDSVSKVYVAGVGKSPTKSNGVNKALVSAATKALLEAGIIFDNVDKGVIGLESASNIKPADVFNVFDDNALDVKNVILGHELATSWSLVSNGTADCLLMVTVEKTNAYALILISDKFLWRHPYLKDSAAVLAKANLFPSKAPNGGGLEDVCKTVWMLRGWSKGEVTNARTMTAITVDSSDQSFELNRIGSQKISDWTAVEHKHDGKDRLGYNPLYETREICEEDLDAVRAYRGGKRTTTHSVQLPRRGGDKAALAKL